MIIINVFRIAVTGGIFFNIMCGVIECELIYFFRIYIVFITLG